MNTLRTLERRRDLVLMSCDMQRATIVARVARLEGHRGLALASGLLRAVRLVGVARLVRAAARRLLKS